MLYIDPPYPGNGVNYKHNMREWADHSRLAHRLEHAKCKWILSSYDSPEVRSMYEGYNIIAAQSYSGMKAEKTGKTRVLNEEVLVMNYEPAHQENLHFKARLQPGFEF